MGTRSKNGWAIAKQSWKILLKEKSILPFPLFSALACLLVVCSFVAPFLVFPGALSWLQMVLDEKSTNPPDQNGQVMVAALCFAFYFLNYFVIVFFNTALAACAVDSFRGKDATVQGGLQVACKRLPQVLAWALFAATVGTILRFIGDRSKLVGKIVIAIIGAAWSIGTYFIVPTLAVEGLGPIAALKKSTKIVSEVWGEGLVGNLGLGLISLLLFIPVFLFVPLVAILFASQLITNSVLVVASMALVVLYILGIFVATSAMQQIFIAGLYLYATEKKVPAGFSEEVLQSAFEKKAQ